MADKFPLRRFHVVLKGKDRASLGLMARHMYVNSRGDLILYNRKDGYGYDHGPSTREVAGFHAGSLLRCIVQDIEEK